MSARPHKRRWSARWIVTNLVPAILVVALAVGVLTDKVDAADAGVVLGLLVFAALVLSLRLTHLRRLVESLKGVSVGGLTLEFFEVVHEAAATAESDSEPGQESTSPPDLIELRLKLEAKLVYVVKWMLPPEPGASSSFATIGSLRYDKLISEAEARSASGLFSLGEVELRSVDPATRTRLLNEMETVVGGIRASVHHSMVRAALVERVGESGVSDVQFKRDRRRTRRPFFLGRTDDGRSFDVVPVFALARDSKLVTQARRRLGAGTGGRRVLVVPNATKVPSRPDEEVAVIRLSELTDLLSSTTPGETEVVEDHAPG